MKTWLLALCQPVLRPSSVSFNQESLVHCTTPLPIKTFYVCLKKNIQPEIYKDISCCELEYVVISMSYLICTQRWSIKVKYAFVCTVCYWLLSCALVVQPSQTWITLTHCWQHTVGLSWLLTENSCMLVDKMLRITGESKPKQQSHKTKIK